MAGKIKQVSKFPPSPMAEQVRNSISIAKNGENRPVLLAIRQRVEDDLNKANKHATMQRAALEEPKNAGNKAIQKSLAKNLKLAERKGKLLVLYDSILETMAAPPARPMSTMDLERLQKIVLLSDVPFFNQSTPPKGSKTGHPTQ